MNIYIIIVLLFLLNSYSNVNGIDILNEEIPKEIKHGSLQNDFWSNGQFYEYYINITDYELNEENIFEMYTHEEFNIFIFMNIYIILTNSTIEEIINNKIKPKTSDLYIKVPNNYKLDSSTNLNYFYMPYKKTSINQNYLIIYISGILDNVNNQKIYYSISKRIPIFHLNYTENISNIFSGSLESRDDIHLYYKFKIDKDIDLKKIIYFFL